MPSLVDLFFVAVIAWSFLAGEKGWERLLMDGDAGVHLRIGDWVREHGNVPHQDLFGFSKPAGEWLAYEWLAGVLFSLGGLKGMVLLCGVVLAIVPALLLLQAVARGAHEGMAMGLAFLAASALQIHFLARPHVFTLLLLAVSMWLIQTNRLWWLPPVMALWANLHGGFFLMFPLLGLMFVGRWLETRRFDLHLAAVGIASALATLATPYTWHLHAHIATYLRSDWVMRNVDEFKSPSFRSETLLCFLVVLFASLAATTLLIQRKKYVETLWILFLGYCALASVRHTTVFLVVAVPIVAAELWRGNAPPAFRRMTPWAAVAVVVIAIAPGLHWPSNFPADLFPISLVEKHHARLAASRVFTTDQWADYLIYRNYPQQRVFMDARHNYFGPQIGNDFIKLCAGHPDWRKLAEQYRFDSMLLPPEIPLNAILAERRDWRIVERDQRAVLWEKIAGETAVGNSISVRVPSPGALSTVIR